MLKRLCLAFAGLFALVSIAHGAGTVPGFSLTPQFDLSGAAAPGCKLYVIQAGTVATPQNAYSDSGLTQLLPNPMTCDAGARLPQFFLADGTIKLRLTKSNGSQIFVGDNLLVVGPSSGGGGGGGTVDPTTIIATGDFKLVYNTGVLAGFVRCNGRTIGSATSGATERANADTSALFAFLWGADPNLAVSGGRGASPAADFAANKTLTLPDCRGRTLASLDDMGNTASGRFSSTYFGTSPTVLGAAGGNQLYTMQRSDMPNVAPTFTGTPGTATSNNSNIPVNATNVANSTVGGTQPYVTAGAIAGSLTSTFTPAGTIQSLNGGVTQTNMTTIQPTLLLTTYIKL